MFAQSGVYNLRLCEGKDHMLGEGIVVVGVSCSRNIIIIIRWVSPIVCQLID